MLCFHWMNLNDVLSLTDVQSTIKYVTDRNVMADDVKYFDHFCNVRLVCKMFRIMNVSKVYQLVTSGFITFRRAVTLTAIPSC
jgi:hypothetical protein